VAGTSAGFPPWRTVYGLYQRWHATGAAIAVPAEVGIGWLPLAVVLERGSCRARARRSVASPGRDVEGGIWLNGHLNISWNAFSV
jgi:hypothetical protein